MFDTLERKNPSLFSEAKRVLKNIKYAGGADPQVYCEPLLASAGVSAQPFDVADALAILNT